MLSTLSRAPGRCGLTLALLPFVDLTWSSPARPPAAATDLYAFVGR